MNDTHAEARLPKSGPFKLGDLHFDRVVDQPSLAGGISPPGSCGSH